MCGETLGELLLLLLLLRLLPFSFRWTEGKRLAFLERSAVGRFPWSSSHTEDRKWNYSLRAPLEIISRTRELFFPPPLKKKKKKKRGGGGGGGLGGHDVQILCQISRNGRNGLLRPCVLWQLRDDYVSSLCRR